MPAEIHRAYTAATDEHFRSDQTTPINIVTDGINKRLVGLWRVGMERVILRNDQQCDGAWRVARSIAAEFRIKGWQHVNPSDVDTWRTSGNGFEIRHVDQAIAMLQIQGNLFFASPDGLCRCSAPGGNRIAHLEARRQRRAAVDCPAVDITLRANPVIVVSPNHRPEWRAGAALTIAETDLPGFWIECKHFHQSPGHGRRAGRLARVMHRHFRAGARQVINLLPDFYRLLRGDRQPYRRRQHRRFGQDDNLIRLSCP